MTNKFIYLTVATAGLSLSACASTDRQLLAECGADEACLQQVADRGEEIKRRQAQSYIESRQSAKIERPDFAEPR